MRCSWKALTLVLGLVTSVARAEDTAAAGSPPQGPQAKTPPAASTPSPASATYEGPSTAWHLYGGLGFGAADGKYGDVSRSPCSGSSGSRRRASPASGASAPSLQFGSMDPAEDPNIPPERRTSGSLPTWNGPASRRS